MITWFKADKIQPKMHEELDDAGVKYQTSRQLLVFTNDEEQPVHFATFEDGRWAVEGIFSPAPKVTHWAYINQPDGHFIK